jgi:hypothetical protein
MCLSDSRCNLQTGAVVIQYGGARLGAVVCLVES